MDTDQAKSYFAWSSPKFWLLLLVILGLIAVVIISILRDKIVSQNQWQVSSIGRGRLAYEPDTASIILGVTVEKTAKPEIALKELNEKMTNVISALKKSGIANPDIATENYSLSPQYDFADNISKLSGYNASQTVVVKARDIKNSPDKVSEIIALATREGANRIENIVFEASNFDDLKQEVRLKAIADAKNKAVVIAANLGVELGKVVGWWDNWLAPIAQYNYYSDGKGGANSYDPNVPVGNRELVLEVTINYLVK